MSIIKFAKGACARARAGELAEDQLASTAMAENARKSRKQLARRVISKGGVLTAKEARGMTRDRLELEEKREEERLKAYEKRYSNALIKVFKGTVKWRKHHQDQTKAYRLQWRGILEEVVVNVDLNVE